MDILRLVDAAASRLRLLQNDCAEEPADRRRQRLVDELRRATDQVPLPDRRVFLAELAERFPTWEQTSPAQPAPKADAPLPPSMDLPAIVGRLLELGKKLPEDRRRETLNQLRQAWGGNSKPEPADAPPAGIRAVLGLSPDDPLDPARFADLLKLLLEFVQVLDPLVSGVWQTVRGRQGDHRDWRALIAQYLRGGADSPVPHELLSLRQLIAALANALVQLGSRFQQQHLSRFRPDDIEEAVRMEGGWSINPQGKCWRKYCQLAPVLEESAVKSAIYETIAAMVEPMIARGQAGRTSGA